VAAIRQGIKGQGVSAFWSGPQWIHGISVLLEDCHGSDPKKKNLHDDPRSISLPSLQSGVMLMHQTFPTKYSHGQHDLAGGSAGTRWVNTHSERLLVA
jgi:hypothetical protein